MFSSVLIANRGEIAVRIFRTCREMGIRTIAVCSDADRDSAVTRLADACVRIGPASPRRSYLNAAAIVTAALQTGAEAIHPGYGFLSEDPDFAEICETAGVTFVGPSARVIRMLGDKARAREVAAKAGLPVVAGTSHSPSTFEEARSAADAIGYPLMIKATAGGGGRGITVVRDPAMLGRAWDGARTCAQAAFGDSRLYLERYVENARHIEVQVLGDGAGSVIHLGARDCSVQRRRQKLIEETPAPGLGAELTERICRAAVRAARHVDYAGAGTFEFLVERSGAFYLMEVNCRLQVEHPVTELVTGIDLVREQLNVAAGHGLSIGQADVRPRGVSIECRINAEDPAREFVPTPGVLAEFVAPAGPFVRVDTHVRSGSRVTADYDPLLAKIAVWAPDREQAIARADRALGELRVSGRGMSTTTGFLRDVLRDPRFRAAEQTTTMVDDLSMDRRADQVPVTT